MGAIEKIISAEKIKNHLYNGGFTFFQRGNQSNVGTPFSYTADRWGIFTGVAGNQHSVTKINHSLFPNLKARKACRVQRNPGQSAVSGIQFNQTLETLDSEALSGKEVTLCFRAMKGPNYSTPGDELTASILTTQTHFDLNYITGWTQIINSPVSVVLSSSMADFKLTTTVPENTRGLAVNFLRLPSGTAGADDWFQLEDVRLVEGAAESPFLLRGGDYASELQQCQRFFEKSFPIDVAPGSVTGISGGPNFIAIGGVESEGCAPFKVQKRASPMIVTYGNNGIAGQVHRRTVGDVAATVVESNEWGISRIDGAWAAGNAIGFHFTASSEL